MDCGMTAVGMTMNVSAAGMEMYGVLFYEQPFGRSGQGTAWEGLSKYDLKRPNAWYWSRLKEFAEKGSKDGLLLFHENYFQHNILEAGAHWVDCPWRSSNNINETGFPNPFHLPETNVFS